jgi:hypothetical protein
MICMHIITAGPRLARSLAALAVSGRRRPSLSPACCPPPAAGAGAHRPVAPCSPARASPGQKPTRRGAPRPTCLSRAKRLRAPALCSRPKCMTAASQAYGAPPTPRTAAAPSCLRCARRVRRFAARPAALGSGCPHCGQQSSCARLALGHVCAWHGMPAEGALPQAGVNEARQRVAHSPAEAPRRGPADGPPPRHGPAQLYEGCDLPTYSAGAREASAHASAGRHPNVAALLAKFEHRTKQGRHVCMVGRGPAGGLRAAREGEASPGAAASNRKPRQPPSGPGGAPRASHRIRRTRPCAAMPAAGRLMPVAPPLPHPAPPPGPPRSWSH